MSFIRHLNGADPSRMLFDGLTAAFPDTVFGWDMPGGDGPKCLMVLDAGRYPTPVTQSMTLRLTVVRRNPDGSGDWVSACALTRRIHRWLLQHATDYPLCAAEVQSGPLRTYDDRLGCETAYSTVLLTVTATSTNV